MMGFCKINTLATDEHIVEMQIELNAEIECEFQGEKWLSMQRKM